jgi:hypothetical protein
MQIIVIAALAIIVALLFSVASRKRVTLVPDSKDFDELYDDIGLFQYDESGFTMTLQSQVNRIEWKDIDELNVFKEDLITIDSIAMEIVCNGNYITINEETPGWYQFVIKTKQIFSQVPSDWDVAIIQPPFERNYQTIYRKTVHT